MYVYRCSARALLVRLAGEAWSSSSFFFMLLKQAHNPLRSWNRHMTQNAPQNRHTTFQAHETDAQPFKLLKQTHNPPSPWNRHMIHNVPKPHRCSPMKTINERCMWQYRPPKQSHYAKQNKRRFLPQMSRQLPTWNLQLQTHLYHKSSTTKTIHT